MSYCNAYVSQIDSILRIEDAVTRKKLAHQAARRWWSKIEKRKSKLYMKIIRRLLWPKPLTFWSQYLIITSTNPHTSVTILGWTSIHWFLRYNVYNVYRTSWLTHRLKCNNPKTESTPSQKPMQKFHPSFVSDVFGFIDVSIKFRKTGWIQYLRNYWR